MEFNTDALLDKWERKLQPYAIPHLMRYIVGGMGIVYVLGLLIFQGNWGIYTNLMFLRPAIFQGQIWRLFTFIFLPPATGPFFLIISLYFYDLLGQALESYWGTARFNLYYLLGYIGALIAGLISGATTNHYLNLSLFLAFALLNPDIQLLLFFILPVKVKWLGIIVAVQLLYELITASWPMKLALLFSLLNLFLFFGRMAMGRLRQLKRSYDWRKNTRD